MTPYDAYSIKIHARTVTLAGISHEKKESNKDNKKTVAKTCIWDLISEVNNTPQINDQGVKDLIRNLQR